MTPRSVGPATEGGTKAGSSQGTSAPVAEMRKAAAALGWAKEANEAKGKKEVLAVLQQAQAAPRPLAAQTPQAEADGGGSSSEEEEAGEEEEALQGSDVFEVESLLVKRRNNSAAQYLIKWKGYSSTLNSWKLTKHLPQNLVREFEDERGPEEETDDDAESGESADESGTADGLAAAPAATGRKRAQTPAASLTGLVEAAGGARPKAWRGSTVFPGRRTSLAVAMSCCRRSERGARGQSPHAAAMKRQRQPRHQRRRGRGSRMQEEPQQSRSSRSYICSRQSRSSLQ